MKPKHDREKTKRLLAAVVAILIILSMVISLVIPFVYGAEPAGLSLSGEIGFEGRYRVFNTTPLTARVENTSPDTFQGELLFKVNSADDNTQNPYTSTSNGRNSIYSKTVTLAPGESAEIKMNVRIPSVRRQFRLELVDSKGNTAATADLTASPAQPGSTFAGVLSDNPSALSYMRLLQLKTGEPDIGDRLVQMTPESLDLPELVKNFDLIIINDFNTALLTDTQRNVLQDWVRGGGALALGTGANYMKVLAGLPGFVNISNAVEHRLNSISLYDTEGGHVPLDEPLYVNSIRAESAKPQLMSGDVILSSVISAGQGHILLHGFDLGNEPFPTAIGTKYDTLNTLYSDYIMPRGDEMRYMDDGFVNSARNLPLLSDAIVNLSFYIVLIYGVMLGPVLYLVLKKRDARERALLIIPALSVAITLVILLMGMSNPYKKPLANNITRVTLSPDSSVGSVQSTVGVFTPSSGDIKLGFRENFSPTPYTEPYYYNYSNSSPRDYYKLSFDNPASITFYSKPAWHSESYLATDGFYSFGGGLTADFLLNDGEVTGTLTNNTGYLLSDILLRFNGSFKLLPDPLPPGETQSIAFDFADLYLNGNMRIYDLFTSNIYNTAGSRQDFRDGYFKQSLMASGLSMLDNPRYVQTGYGYPSSYSYNKYMSEPTHSSLQYIDILAINYDPIVDHGLTVNGKKPLALNTNLFMLSAPIEYSGSGSIEFPLGVIKPLYINTDYGYSTNDDWTMVYVDPSADFVEFNYPVPGGMELTEMEFDFPGHLGAMIFNHNIEEYEELSDAPYTQNLTDYVGEDGTITIRYTDGLDHELMVPAVRLKGDVQ